MVVCHACQYLQTLCLTGTYEHDWDLKFEVLDDVTNSLVTIDSATFGIVKGVGGLTPSRYHCWQSIAKMTSTLG